MRGLASQIRTNIIYGIVALMPIAVVVYVLFKLFGFLKGILEPLTPFLDDSPYFGTGLLLALTLFILLALCYVFGLLIKTQFGGWLFENAKSLMSDNIPGYEIIANLLSGIAGDRMSYPAALITLSAPGTAVLGFIMEDEGDPYLTVYVPSAPVLTAGAIHVVERSRVQLIEGSNVDAANCVTQWGIGLKEFRGATRPVSLS